MRVLDTLNITFGSCSCIRHVKYMERADKLRLITSQLTFRFLIIKRLLTTFLISHQSLKIQCCYRSSGQKALEAVIVELLMNVFLSKIIVCSDFFLFAFFSSLMRGNVFPKNSLRCSLHFTTKENFHEFTRKNWNCLQFVISMLWRRFTIYERSSGELNFLSTEISHRAEKKLCCSVAFSFGYIKRRKCRIEIYWFGNTFFIPSKKREKRNWKSFLLLLNVRQKVIIFHVENCCS